MCYSVWVRDAGGLGMSHGQDDSNYNGSHLNGSGHHVCGCVCVCVCLCVCVCVKVVHEIESTYKLANVQ